VFKIEKKPFGYLITFGGFITKDEMDAWVADAKKILASPPPSFGVFVDMRSLKPLPKDAQASMEAGQKLFKQAGMARSVVVLDNAITTYQFREIARATGIAQWERYLNASARADWQRAGEDWLTRGVDPDKAQA
jgi:hypothetical protein